MMDKSDFHVTDTQLAEILEINLTRLYQIIDFFDSDPNDAWSLNLDEHFVWQIKTHKSRRFSEIGALVLAKYLDSIDQKSLWRKLKDWVQQKKRKTMQALVEIRIREVVKVDTLVKLNNRHFITRKQTIYILATSASRLDKAFDDIKRSDKPLIIGNHFADIGGERYYSLSGFVKIAKHLSNRELGLTKPDRRLWCEAVELTSKPVIKLLQDEHAAKQQKIQQAINTAKSIAKKTCQITKDKKSNTQPNISVTGHHLFDQETYPHLATALDNILVIRTDIHEHFHQWMGGPDKSCTIEDFIKYVTLFYPDSPVLGKLMMLKQILKK